ncbi:hypothetical protein FRX31_027740 [Thalictrum thalictroides]|uniref:Uncharacterized protein n=1 Tax=Thalictrum thalictroides TaxID=46969 RepID=A0A7J6VCQ2_THATH|nr:hypothetical protein FRX31_027740 [Thalictrum thalictroides]
MNVDLGTLLDPISISSTGSIVGGPSRPKGHLGRRGLSTLSLVGNFMIGTGYCLEIVDLDPTQKGIVRGFRINDDEVGHQADWSGGDWQLNLPYDWDALVVESKHHCL